MNSKWIKAVGIAFVLGISGLLLFNLFRDQNVETIDFPTALPPTEIPSLHTPPPESINLFSGLIYKTADGLFQVTDAGAALPLAECSADLLSTDKMSMFYQQDGDIWQLDLENCASKNISSSPSVWEVDPQIWPSNPNKILVGIDPEMSAGAPAIFDLATGDFLYLDGPGGWTNSGVAPSPDGRKIALRSNNGPSIYYVNLQIIEPLNLSDFNLDQNDFTRIEGPAWSPDGNKLAWVVGYQGQIGHLILNFVDNSYQLLHLYSPVGRGGWPLPLVWSPNGEWLVADVWAEDLNQMGLYILAADGDQEHFLGAQLAFPLWSPDSQTLIFTEFNTSTTISYVTMEDFQEYLLPIPNNGVPVFWSAP